jgi:YbbR domain-containing protein
MYGADGVEYTEQAEARIKVSKGLSRISPSTITITFTGLCICTI